MLCKTCLSFWSVSGEPGIHANRWPCSWFAEIFCYFDLKCLRPLRFKMKGEVKLYSNLNPMLGIRHFLFFENTYFVKHWAEFKSRYICKSSALHSHPVHMRCLNISICRATWTIAILVWKIHVSTNYLSTLLLVRSITKLHDLLKRLTGLPLLLSIFICDTCLIQSLV